MADRWVAVACGFRYPVGASLAIVERAGGLSQMTPAQRATVVFRDVSIGERCDDMPSRAAALYLSRGDIARVVDVARVVEADEA